MATITQHPEPRAGRLALASLALCLLLASLGTSIANVALPTLAEAFGAPFARVQWVVVAYLLAITVTVVAAGRAGDALGRRRMLVAGVGLFTMASLACAAAPTLGLLIAARVAQGMGAAVMMALALAFVAQAVPKERAGRAMGWLGTMSAVGTALGPTLGGVLTARFGWPSLFLAAVPVGLVAMALAARTLPASTRVASHGPFDHAGAVLLAVTLGAYSLAMTADHGRFDAHNGVLLAIAIVAAWAFVRRERRAVHPLLRLALLRNPTVGAGVTMSFLVTTVVMATLVVGPFYLARGLGLDTARVGMAMSVGPVVAALAGVPAGRLVDRIGAQRSTLAGLVVMAGGAALLAALPTGLGIGGYVGALAVLTAGYAWFQAANNSAVMTDAPQDERGVISGVLNLARNVGLVTGASVMGTVFATATGAELATAAPEAVARGMRITFALGAGLLFVAVAVARASRAASRAAATECAACNDGPRTEAVRAVASTPARSCPLR